MFFPRFGDNFHIRFYFCFMMLMLKSFRQIAHLYLFILLGFVFLSSKFERVLKKLSLAIFEE